ncbi:ATP-binding protein [Segatella copri]|uniref:ATP-binding protein n=1 Tax=Segatella copri TaxID=165179 RepID=UPI003D06DBF3
MGDPTLADAIMDRLVANASKIELKGDSMRQKLKKINYLCKLKSRTEILVPIAVIAWYRLHRYAWYRYSAIVNFHV